MPGAPPTYAEVTGGVDDELSSVTTEPSVVQQISDRMSAMASDITKQTFVLCGAGSAGMGIASFLHSAMVGWCKLNSFDPWIERRLVSNSYGMKLKNGFKLPFTFNLCTATARARQ